MENAVSTGTFSSLFQISWTWYALSVFISCAFAALWYCKLFARQWKEAIHYDCSPSEDPYAHCCSYNTFFGFIKTMIMQGAGIALLGLMYFVLTAQSIWLSVIVAVSISGWLKAALRFQIKEYSRWIIISTINVGYFFLMSTIMILLASL